MWIGHGAPENGVGDAEHCGVCADAESESDDGDESECGIFSELAEAVARVLPKIFEQTRKPYGADVFGNYCSVTERAASAVLRFTCGNSVGRIFFSFEIEMIAKFFVEIIVWFARVHLICLL